MPEPIRPGRTPAVVAPQPGADDAAVETGAAQAPPGATTSDGGALAPAANLPELGPRQVLAPAAAPMIPPPVQAALRRLAAKPDHGFWVQPTFEHLTTAGKLSDEQALELLTLASARAGSSAYGTFVKKIGFDYPDPDDRAKVEVQAEAGGETRSDWSKLPQRLGESDIVFKATRPPGGSGDAGSKKPWWKFW